MTGVLATVPVNAKSHWVALLLCAGLWTVWAALQIALPLNMAVTTVQTHAIGNDSALMLAAASVWVLAWSVIHRWATGSSAILPHLRAVGLALLMEVLLVQWLVPIAWFALAWNQHDVAMAIAQCVVVGLLVRHQLRLVQAGDFDSETQRAWAAVVLVSALSVGYWQTARLHEDSDKLPFSHNTQPAVFMLYQGSNTAEALANLWPDQR